MLLIERILKIYSSLKERKQYASSIKRAGKKAAKYYENLDDKTARKVNKAIEEISNSPFRGTHIKRLVGNLEGKL